MTVILITQDIGSCRDEIAASIAACLGLDLVSQEQLELLVARRMQIGQSTLHRLVAGDASALERWRIDWRRLARYTAQEIVKVAARDNVVVASWGAASPLRAIQHVMCVYVCGCESPDAVAMLAHARTPRRMISRGGPSPSRTWQCLIGHGRERRDPFDVYLDPARDSATKCIEHVRRLAQSPQFRTTAASLAMLAQLLQDVHGLPHRGAQPADSCATGVLEVEVGSQRVPLMGVASNEQAIARIEEHLHGKRVSGATHERPLPSGML